MINVFILKMKKRLSHSRAGGGGTATTEEGKEYD
jgi:hypothetical protein